MRRTLPAPPPAPPDAAALEVVERLAGELAQVAALASDPHPGLLTWRAAFVKAFREFGFEPIRPTVGDIASRGTLGMNVIPGRRE